MEQQPSHQPTVNYAGDQAYVGQQIGQQIGQQHIVHNSNTYSTHQDSPTELFARARRALEISAPRMAAELIERALADGLDLPEAGYYWQLALLAGRPFDHLSASDLDKLTQAGKLSMGSGVDTWVMATEVITGLLRSYTSQVTEQQTDDKDRPNLALDALERLPEELRAEIGRHLVSVLNGAIQDRLDRNRRRQIEEHRMGKGRRWRVPLFFEPDPAEPWLRPTAQPAVDFGTWLALVAGTVLTAGGIAPILWRAIEDSPLGGGFIALWAVVSCAGTARSGVRFLHSWRRVDRWADRSEFARMPEQYSSDFGQLVIRRFAGTSPTGLHPAQFEAEKALLGLALNETYLPGGAVPASQLDWLVRWHVRRVMSGLAWHRPPEFAGHGVFSLWSLSSVASICVAVSLIEDWSYQVILLLFASLVAVVVGILCLGKGIAVFTEKLRFAEEFATNSAMLEAERGGWQDEQRRLLDRPDDAQLAEWLDYDKDHIRLSVMKQWGLSNQDVIAHVVLTEPDPQSASARYPDGPRRYARYVVRLFLLTSNGVRQLDVNLDFASGAENKQQRRAFRYDAIASAVIEEPTVRRRGRRQVASPAGGGRSNGAAKPIRRQALKLTLVNGERIDINAEYDGLLAEEDRYDNDALLALEMETSGAVSTLRALESVAGEGREWIARERDRNRHAAADYQRTIE